MYKVEGGCRIFWREDDMLFSEKHVVGKVGGCF